ncbi:MAG: c-type cytochrome [Planctomycetales bacterium]|nr:c-type cytochrome [Planctomycetales bacterium]
MPRQSLSGTLPILLICAAFMLFSPPLQAVPPTEAPPTPEAPKIAEASDEGNEAIGGFQYPKSMDCRLFAAEPLVANPVAFQIDDRGRLYVCESFRQGRGVTDNRKHDQKWLEADLAAQTVADREAFHRRLLGDKVAEYTRYDDQIRVLEDRDGDGAADFSQVFANGFNAIVDGTAAGVLAHQGDVFLTCIPHLWRLRDQDGDGRADQRDSLHYGYGVRVAFRGHDSHGLIIGPDGRLYFSIGDRGYNIEHEGRHHFDPASGAVFRCELDGSNLEVFARGLRNPQELAFDDYGNLFTGDNNSDSGDRARWVYVVQGGDTGWRMYYQYLNDRGPFNREQIWHPWNKEVTPAYTVPPIANFADGPSGLVHYPGTGLSDEFKDRFLLCDFRGGPANSGIRSFRVEPQGAFFSMMDDQQPFWRILATDLAFGPDGALYVSDWVNGWEGEGKGRIYRFIDREAAKSELVRNVQQILAKPPAEFPLAELEQLLGHPDRRVRLKAQWELAARTATTELLRASEFEGLAQLHGIWGLGQIGRRANVEQVELAWSRITALTEDSNDEVRAQACKTLADAPQRFLNAEAIIRCLADGSPRVRYFAAIAAGQCGRLQRSAPPANGTTADFQASLVKLLIENADEDPIVRHGGIMGLAGAVDERSLAALAKHADRSVRLAAVVALRKQGSESVAQFLSDADPQVSLEAARAIHDTPLEGGMKALAALIRTPTDSDPLLRRSLNANFRLGTPEHAMSLARFAAESTAEQRRVDALEMLASWAEPSSRDRVLGAWRPLPPRDAAPAASALRQFLPSLLSGPQSVQDATIKAAAALQVRDITPTLAALVKTDNEAPHRRAAALIALQQLEAAETTELLPLAAGSEWPVLRAASRRVSATRKPDGAFDLLAKGAAAGETVERQDALEVAAEIADRNPDTRRQAQALFATQLDQLVSGKVPADTALDVIEGARRLKDEQLDQLIAAYHAQLPADGLGAQRPLLHGGNADRGQVIFFERTNVSCVRCHKIGDRGGEVGPALTKVASDKNREYLLESILKPNAKIAKNFESIQVRTDDGVAYSGILKRETEDLVELMTAEGKLLSISKDTIDARKPGLSAMPEDLHKRLSPFELRDLVEYLSTLK